MLIVISGLPGVGKSTVAKLLAQKSKAIYLRADTIEQAMVEGGFTMDQIGGAGYQVAARVARENLRLGRWVVIDCVNPWLLTREMWRAAAREANSPILEVELVCSNQVEHRHRVELRTSDVEGLRLPTWQDVLDRDYHPWDQEPLRIDTGQTTPAEAADQIANSIQAAAVDGSPLQAHKPR